MCCTEENGTKPKALIVYDQDMDNSCAAIYEVL